MIAISLQSGSNGNCIYVETTGTRLLIDAGISGIQAERRLAAHGRRINDVDALLVSHDHADHSRIAAVYGRKFGLPVYITEPTRRVARRWTDLGHRHEVRTFVAGETMEIGDARVETVPTPHDAVDGVAFVIDDGERRLGVLTDLGHVFAGLAAVVESLDAVIIESNYDPEMLAHGSYPPRLKARIAGPGGHISNQEAAVLVGGAVGRRLKWACLAHLSAENNRPEVALATHRELLGPDFPLYVAGRYESSGVMEV
jgi:phosphoribosyl 1,2-cyclic phosphodiesterase